MRLAGMVAIAHLSTCSLLTAPAAAQDESSPPRDLPTARRITTPAGTRAWEHNNCLVIELRRGASPPEDLDIDEYCGTRPLGSVGSQYTWLPDFLVGATRLAEEALCGREGCVLRDRTVRLYLTWGEAPTVRTDRPSSTEVAIVLNTVVVDLAESATLHYLREAQLYGHVRPYREWLAQMRARSGACDPVNTGDRRVSSQEEFRLLRAGAQVFYAFLLVHELAHLRPEGACPAQGFTLEAEQACDTIALQRLMARGAVMPNFVAAVLVSMAHYQSVLNPVLAATTAQEGRRYSDLHPAAQWHPRAVSLVNQWETFCSRSSNAQRPTCTAGWRQAVEDARGFLAPALPPSCDPSLPRRPRTSYETSRTCLFAAGPRAGEVQFFRDAQPAALGSPCQDQSGHLGFAVPNGTRPENVVAPELSVTCRFTSGPRAGQTQWYPGAFPVPIGGPCGDGIASLGEAVPNAPHDISDLTRTCRFESGPRAGQDFTYPPNVPPVPVGAACNDGFSSVGVAVQGQPPSGLRATQTCRFMQGPRTGETQWFPLVVPLAVGWSCTDGMANAGVAVPDERHTVSDLSRTCSLRLGPRQGQVHYLPNGIPTAVGAPCQDGAGSFGAAVPDARLPTVP